MIIEYPPEAISDDIMLEYLYNLQQALQETHNVEGAKCRNKEISIETFRRWQRKVFEPESTQLCEEIMKVKEKIIKEYRDNVYDKRSMVICEELISNKERLKTSNRFQVEIRLNGN